MWGVGKALFAKEAPPQTISKPNCSTVPLLTSISNAPKLQASASAKKQRPPTLRPGGVTVQIYRLRTALQAYSVLRFGRRFGRGSR